MSRKFIGQVNNQNFIYPNNYLAEYDTEIVHDVNENSVSGTVTNFTATTVNASGITFTHNYTWAKNNAETYVTQANQLMLYSVHCMVEGQDYFKPWRLVNYEYIPNTGSTTSSGSNTFLITPSMMGINSFDNGTYYFEFRFIGHRAIYPVCQTYTISTLPTPTPTPTPTPVTPTPTPLPITPTPTPLPYTSGATINVTDTGYIKYDTPTGTTYQYIGTTGVVTLTNCLICSSINVGIPFADLANFTIIQCGSTCGAVPTPTPTPTGTADNVHYIMTDCQTYQTKYSQSLPNGTYNSGDRVMGSYLYYYVITGFTPSTPDPSLIFYVTATGEYGCP
jgi:hypothetical protein